ncbi:DUF5996 family protein [Rhodococcus sp. X156]|uniref:DUF5996 family protein n=1 Tax=Rhodococcus sp. X156 TaxID=2499145 RepID=UPI000FDA5933|nr:DUF5996 family protein [Rhodococcus sp. X156]
MPEPSVPWPSLRVADWTPTRDTLHMWTQILGKVRLVDAPMVNHWWQVPLYVTARGLSTSAVPHGHKVFDMELDFFDHQLLLRSSDGQVRSVALEPKPVADFYAQAMQALDELGLGTQIQASPNEVDPAIPFAEDDQHSQYDPAAAHLFWAQLVRANRALQQFRSSFIGKCSPVHLFWGSLDLACTRFSGRPAPTHPGGAPHCADWVMVEAYSHEVSSAGFWPGGGEEGAFYSYAYPEPPGFAASALVPAEAAYDAQLQQFLLPYEAVRTAEHPDQLLQQFLRTTYEAAADGAGWDRSALERDYRRLG